MIYTIKITDQADNDIRNIYEYIAYELQSPENASGQLDRIEKCIMSLDDMPERYRFYDREPWKSRGLHIVPVDNYCVLYIVDNDDRTVSIMRVMYGGRDIDVQLDKYTKYEEQCKSVFVELVNLDFGKYKNVSHYGFNAVCKEKQYDWVCYMVTFGSVYNWIRNKRYVF